MKNPKRRRWLKKMERRVKLALAVGFFISVLGMAFFTFPRMFPHVTIKFVSFSAFVGSVSGYLIITSAAIILAPLGIALSIFDKP